MTRRCRSRCGTSSQTTWIPNLILARNSIVHLCSMHWATTRTEYTMIMYIKYTDPFSILYQPYTTPYTFHCNKYQEFSDFTVLYYCTIHCILSYYCTFYSIVLWYMYRPRYWAIFSNSAVQLFSCKYVTIKLSWVELSKGLLPPIFRYPSYCARESGSDVLWWVRLSVCLSVWQDISGTPRAIFTKFFVHVAYGRDSVLLRHVDDRSHRLRFPSPLTVHNNALAAKGII